MWLEWGLGVLSGSNFIKNDFILPSFNAAGQALQQPMSYQESSALSKQVLSRLKVPVYDEESHHWEESTELLVGSELASFWTEHSPRSVIPTAAQVLECPKDERNFLGRWSPGGSDDYGRAYRVVVMGIQRKVVRAVLSGDSRLKEHDVLDRLQQWGESRDLTDSQILHLKAGLSEGMEKFWAEIKKAGGPPDEEVPTTSSPVLSQAPVVEPPSSKRGKYLIVYTRNRKQAKLHKVGGCAWTTVTLADSQEVIKLATTMYNSRCKLCWPEVDAGKGKDQSEDTSDSDF